MLKRPPKGQHAQGASRSVQTSGLLPASSRSTSHHKGIPGPPRESVVRGAPAPGVPWGLLRPPPALAKQLDHWGGAAESGGPSPRPELRLFAHMQLALIAQGFAGSFRESLAAWQPGAAALSPLHPAKAGLDPDASHLVVCVPRVYATATCGRATAFVCPTRCVWRGL